MVLRKTWAQLTGKKYYLTGETTVVAGKRLHRIEAVKDMPDFFIKAGEKGGFVENERNLSQSGGAWIGGDACAFDHARVTGNARLFGQVQVSGHARISDRARLYDDVRVADCARVYGDSWLSGAVYVSGHVHVCGRAYLSQNVMASDNAWLGGDVHASGEARIRDNARVSGSTRLLGQVELSGDAHVLGNAWLYNKVQFSSGIISSGCHGGNPPLVPAQSTYTPERRRSLLAGDASPQLA